MEEAEEVQQEPLLSEAIQQPFKQHGDACPGCALELHKLTRQGAPTKELVLVAVLVLCNALPISSLFPFIYFMVEDFGVAETESQIAFYAGFIGSAYMAGRFLSGTPWGIVADKYGCKPVMICGTASIVVFNTLFGFSTAFWMALATRFFLGMFNGLLGTIRAYISEVCREEEQAFGMSLVGTVWGLGLIIGPAIGGYLAQPADNFPSIFPAGSIFDMFPYALPCLCMSAFAAISLAISFSVPESLHKFSAQLPAKSEEGTKKQINSLNEITTGPLSKNWGFISAIILYCIWCLHDMAYSEIFSLWAVSPRTLWGLDMSTGNVGIVLAIAGFALLLFQMVLYPSAEKRLGPIKTCRISAILTVPLVAVHPLIARLHGSWLWATVTIAASVKTGLSVAVMTSSFILTNDQRGVANGVSMSFMSLFKAVGPACAGSLLSWSETRLDASFLPGTWMVFSILALFCFFTILVTFEPILPRYLDHPKAETSVVESATLQRHASFNV